MGLAVGNYINGVNDLIVAQIDRLPKATFYGENIDNGSRISGLSRNLRAPAGGRMINVGDCENTHCGVGFGMMLGGATAVLFAKQLDFLLLGMDHFVSTNNFVRCRPRPDLGSFTVITIVCDQGLQGPQSSFNALGDICSMARVDGYTITNNQDARHVLEDQLGKPGFRFIALSQAMFGTEFLDMDLVYAAPDSSLFQYSSGSDATIVCFNFSLAKGNLLRQKLDAQGLSASLFSANYVNPQNWERISQSVARTRKLVVFDDSRSIHTPAHKLMYEVSKNVDDFKHVIVTKGNDLEFGVSPEEFHVDYDAVIAQITGQVVHVR